MMAYQAWQAWSRKGLQSGADLWLIAAGTNRQLAECHGQAVAALIRNWPDFGAWQPDVLPKVVVGLVERQLSHQEALHRILQRGGQAVAATVWGALGTERPGSASVV